MEVTYEEARALFLKGDCCAGVYDDKMKQSQQQHLFVISYKILCYYNKTVMSKHAEYPYCYNHQYYQYMLRQLIYFNY